MIFYVISLDACVKKDFFYVNLVFSACNCRD